MVLTEPESYELSSFNNGQSQVYEFYYEESGTRYPLTHGTIELVEGSKPAGGTVAVDLNGCTVTGGNRTYATSGMEMEATIVVLWTHGGIETYGYVTFTVHGNTTTQLENI